MLEQGLLVMYLAQHDDSKASGVKRLLVISNAPTLRIQTSIGIISSIVLLRDKSMADHAQMCCMHGLTLL